MVAEKNGIQPRIYKMRAGHCNFGCTSLSALVWGRLFLKMLFEKFIIYVSNDHCRWADEFQISALRKCVTLLEILNDVVIICDHADNGTSALTKTYLQL